MVAARMSVTRADWRPAAAVRSEMSGAGFAEESFTQVADVTSSL